MMVCFAFAALLAMGTIHAGTLHKIWDFDAGAHGVYTLSFSPDGRHIAAVVGPTWDKQFVLVFDAGDPQANYRRFEINPRSIGGISWSPSSQQIMIGITRLRLQDGKTCSVQDGEALPSFVSEDRLVAQAIRPVGPDIPGHPRTGHGFLRFFNPDCQNLGSLDLTIEQSLFDLSAERGLLCVRQDTRTSVIDALTGTVQRDFTSLGRRRVIRFAENGKSICGVVGSDWKEAASCFDVDSGKELATTSEFTYIDINPALHSRRIVLSSHGRIFDFIDFRWVLGSLKKRIVWDFGTKKEVVSWNPQSQDLITIERPAGWPQPYAFDISPDGEYIVEGGAGMVSLYRIEP